MVVKWNLKINLTIWKWNCWKKKTEELLFFFQMIFIFHFNNKSFCFSSLICFFRHTIFVLFFFSSFNMWFFILKTKQKQRKLCLNIWHDFHLHLVFSPKTSSDYIKLCTGWTNLVCWLRWWLSRKKNLHSFFSLFSVSFFFFFILI